MRLYSSSRIAAAFVVAVSILSFSTTTSAADTTFGNPSTAEKLAALEKAKATYDEECAKMK